jgi:outer membrane protein assembly factor BamA
LVELHNLSCCATSRARGGARKEGILSGLAIRLVWKTRDSPAETKRGKILSVSFKQAGVIWGGDYRFLKFTGEAKKYHEVGWDTVFAARLKFGLGDAIGAKDRFPIFEPSTHVARTACALMAGADSAVER